VLLVGLTGGIGTGKSTVSAMLADRGAVVVDADAIVRELQRPGTPVFDAIVERFGHGVVAADGSLDRAALAAVVFTDDAARAELERLVHPPVVEEMQRRLAQHAETDRIVVYDVPLLDETRRGSYDAVVVVDVDPETAVRRLVGHRGMVETDARNRIASQVPRDERLALADRVVDNGGSHEALASQVDELWAWLVEREAAARTAGASQPR
jgi:dephospho-CoA kinase